MTSLRVTIADVAREAGVSQQTVSRAINNKAEISPQTRTHVLAVVERLGYRPSGLARGLVTQKTHTIGLVVPDIANPFFSEMARGAEDAAHLAGYSLLLGDTIEDPEREARVLATLEEKRVDGIVLCSSRLPEDELVALSRRHSNLVLVNRRLPDHQVGIVIVDDVAGARQAVQHLIRLGRRTIGFLAGPQGSHSAQLRTEGYRAGLTEAGLTFDPTLLVPCLPNRDGGFEAANKLLGDRPDVDALFCYNDLVAVGALQACAEMGRKVPDTVAVIGCDDILLAGLVTPPLTTLHSDQRTLGARAMRMVLDKIGGCADGCDEFVLRPGLVVRASAPE